MKIDSMLSTFVETYSKDAVERIDKMQYNFGANYKRYTIDLSNIGESCNTFATWINGYAAYCVEQTNKGQNPTPVVMNEAFDKLMKHDSMLHERPYKYTEIPTFISGYMEGVNTIIKSINEAKSLMMENDVDYQLIGNIDTYADTFTDALKESFDPGMEKLLWASGYKSYQILCGKDKSKDVKKPVIV